MVRHLRVDLQSRKYRNILHLDMIPIEGTNKFLDHHFLSNALKQDAAEGDQMESSSGDFLQGNGWYII
jgi:hypothetical protein